MLKVSASQTGISKVLALNGELDIATVDIFKKTVEEVEGETESVVLDLEKLSFVDSTGVGGLLKVIRNLKANSIAVKVRNISPEVFEVFDLLGLPMLLGNEVFE